MSNTSQKQTAKKPYNPPVLKNLGSYTALTQANGRGVEVDGGTRREPTFGTS
jgi:hypothetical protein